MNQRIKEKIRVRLMAKLAEVDFQGMSSDQYGAWINDLPIPEFASLLDLHAEWASEQVNPTIDGPETNPLDDAWIAIDRPENYDIPPETQVYVLYRDGEIGGPNRIDAFHWGEPTGPLAFAPAEVQP
ncbi:hypothetical protein LB545_07550 [Mesorhizobium sp. BR1-1-6]|uniref:hypothetical protein n=1 Tax=Mesorhizobium sp. BR1-1-6 TaxID=2876648 RepID=UPI001CD05EF7|nr:hypothetical protein [Mesorhizobium sp. BR1-1-6]MBZ9894197.1 hypothetical protein [Mesorhizobium sp. BR1-1-6]